MPGDILKDNFTADELKAMGEEVEPEESTTEPKGEGEAEGEAEAEQAAEKGSESATESGNVEGEGEGDDEGKKDNVQKRIDKITFEKKETERKLDLLKTLGPDEYFKLYPEENPNKGTTETTKAPLTKAKTFSEAASMVVSGGTYDGKTLAEVHTVDPFAAYDLYDAYKDGIRESERAAKDAEDQLRTESERDIQNFQTARAKDFFNKEMKDLTPEEVKKVDSALTSVMEFVKDPKNGTTNLEVAYLFLNKDNLLAEAAAKGAKGLVNKLNNTTVSVKTGGGSGKLSGYDAFLELSASEMAAKLDAMSDPAVKEFINKAPQKLKDKFPAIDWTPFK